MSETELPAEPQDADEVTKALAEAEARKQFLELVQGLDAIVWEMDAQTRKFTFVSDRAGDILGYPISHWLHEPNFLYNRLLHPEDRDLVLAFWMGATNEAQQEFQYRAIAADNRLVWLKESVRVIGDENGRTKLLRGVMVDITKEKQAEELNQQLLQERALRAQLEAEQEALRKSEQRYAQILDSLQDMVFCKIPGSVVVYANKAACNYYGMTVEQLQGITDVPFNEVDYTQKYLRDDLQVFTTGQTVEVQEEPNLRADGETRFFHTIKSPIFDTDGKVVEIVGVSRDITERKQFEKALTCALAEAEAARAQLQGLFMQAPAAIQISRGPNHITETVNPLYRQIIGSRELIGKPVREAFPEFEGQGFFELLDRVYETGKPFVGNEMRALFDRNCDGLLEESFWNFVYQPLLDANGKVYGIMTHAVEVTEQVRARQEIEKKAEELSRLTQALERSNKDLDQFAYVTSHDLKAPLRGIASLSEWIEEDLAENLTDESREHLNLLRGRVHRMEGLINGILQYSRAGRVQNKTETLNVSTLLSEVIELLAPSPTVSIVVDPGMPTLETERVQLEQIFMNLINNAIKHTQRPDAYIRLGVKEVGRYYEFSVTDNGPGIAPEYHQRIWGIFQTLESRDKVEGTGIGLSVVKKIVESRGGRVWIDSELGSGATFGFSWPKEFQAAS
ncbi:MAG TPA: PAS domain S-box protein [Candidatus Obscuribacterales bacterium]